MPFQKGNKLGGRTKGALGKETISKLQRRAYFDERAADMFEAWIRKVRPEYGIDQYMGKAPDKIEHSGEIKTGESYSAEVIALAKQELKKRKTNA